MKKSKKINYEELFDIITPGSRIFLSSGSALPVKTLTEIQDSDHQNLADLEFIHLVTIGDYFGNSKSSGIKYRLKTVTVGEAICSDINAGNIDFVPSSITEIPYLFASEAIGVDIAVIQTSPPDKNGFLNLGLVNAVADIVIRKAPIVIAEINPNVPRTHGETSINIDEFDYILKSSMPMLTMEKKGYNDVTGRIGWHIANLIEDGSTVSLHVGPLYDAIAHYLKRKNGLRIYSHVVSDWVMELISSGAITLERNEHYQRPVTCSSCFGSKKLYKYIDDNPAFEVVPLVQSTYQGAISRIQKLVGIQNVKKIDASAELVEIYSSDSLLYGYDAKLNFSIAAMKSRGGKAVVAVNSVDRDGNSNIVIKHKKDDPAFIRSTQGSTQYVVTEYGVASLLGKSIRERTLAMIDIAHPDHRESLIEEAKELGYLYGNQIYVLENAVNYPFDLETTKTFRGRLEVRFRPIKPSDEDMMRRLFYQFSDETKYLRYFSVIRSMPHEKMQPYVNIDYKTTLSLVGIIFHRGKEEIIAECRYSYNKSQGCYELALVVDEEYQGRGIGAFMVNYLLEIARDYGIDRIVGNVLRENERMAKLLSRCYVKPVVNTAEDEVQYVFNFY